MQSGKVERIKEKQAQQLAQFEEWAKAKNWKMFSPTYSHYDWWCFPVTRPSASFGELYAVASADVEALQQDNEFMQNYRRGVELVVCSWGWDLQRQCEILPSQRSPPQRWTGYGVRLGKMADSLLLFGELNLYKNLKLFYLAICLPQIEQLPLEPWVKQALSH